MICLDRAHLDRRFRTLAALALGAALLTPFGSLPPFALGYWDKAEPLIVWFHLTSGLAALAAALTVLHRPAMASDCLLHPYVLAPLAVGLWSAAAAPFCNLPLLSLFGTAQSGLGAMWFLDLAALTACALAIKDDGVLNRRLGRLAVAAAAAVAALKFWDWHRLNTGRDTLLIYVAAYYGWLALPLPVIALEWQARLPSAIAIAGAFLVAAASHSAAAIGLLVLELAIVWAERRGAWTGRRVVGVSVIAAAGILPFAVIEGVPEVWRIPSLWDRHLVWSMTMAAIRARPDALLLGQGWGRVQDSFQAWLNVSGQRLWNPDWIFLFSDYFNSHDWALESLHAAGVPGMALVFACALVLPLFARPDRRPWALGLAAASLALGGLWFELCLSVPFYALAAARCAQPRPPVSARIAKPAIVLALAIGAAQVTAAGMVLDYGLNVGRLRQGLEASPPRVETVPTDFRGGDLAVAEEIRDALARFSVRAKTEPQAPIRQACLPLLAFLDRRIPRSPTLVVAETGLDAMARIYITGSLAFLSDPDTRDAQLAMWRRWLDRALILAPGRSDLAIPYFTQAIAMNRWDVIGALSKAMLARDPGDPVGLYYQGITVLVGGDRGAGLEMIHRAIDHGIERFMPIDGTLKARLTQ